MAELARRPRPQAEVPLMLLVRDVTKALGDAGVDSPEPDALALIAFCAGTDSAQVRTASARGDLVPEQIDLTTMGAADAPHGSIGDVVARRVARVPLQHIVKGANFRTISLEIGKGVFSPRPETEVVAGAAIEAVQFHAAAGISPVKVADLCAGSGNIGLSIAVEAPASVVTMVELDAAAFAFLERNVARFQPQLGNRVAAVHGDGRTALEMFPEEFDVIVSNPPYIPPGAVPRDPEVALYDPDVALYGLGEDGLEIPRGIAAAAGELLKRGGTFAMEHGDAQGAAVRDLVADIGVFTSIGTGVDLTGRDRFVYATKL